METTTQTKTDFTKLRPGALVSVHQKIKESNTKGEEKERIQIYTGLIIARSGGSTMGATITVRKMSHGVGVEKIFPLNLPEIDKIEVIKQHKVRRAKLNYVRHSTKKMKDA